MIKKINIFFKNFSLEGYIWAAALIVLALINIESRHFSVCPFHNLGIDFCPGCGLGRSIHHLIYLDFAKSFNAHPLGGVAFLIILNRIAFLVKNSLQKLKTKLSY
ncbi:MAG: DUF2752 domain-containing protein [Ignavibacteriales bacterium]|nr:MAG: DUF2752 domain-containing protein [Ignavibacteriales bacterium]